MPVALLVPDMIHLQHEYERRQAAVEALEGKGGPDAERAKTRLRFIRKVLREMEVSRSARSALEWREHHSGQ
jgi:hypothetical protein